MPTPAVLSGIMDPPPIIPVVEMDYVTGEYKIHGEDTTFDALMYNASGSFEDIGLVPGRGITGLHSWEDTDVDGTVPGIDIFPPSIRGTNLMNETLAAAMVSSGGLTAVCEFDVSSYEIWGVNDQCPIFWIYRNSTWGEEAEQDGYVSWETYIESGVQGEGYFENYEDSANTGYQGGSAWEASNDRRYRMSGTWCFDKGPSAGVLRYEGGQSIDGQPQGIQTSYGQTPNSANKNLSFMDKITASHFFGVGVDTQVGDPYTDDSWWWWGHPGWDIRYLAFYRARPVSVLASLSRPPHTPIRVGQLYTEVIHNPIVAPNVFRAYPAAVKVSGSAPKIGIVEHPEKVVTMIPYAPTTIGN